MNTILLALIKQRKNEDKPGFEVPMHPEFVFVQAIAKNQWKARNSKNGEKVFVRKIDKENFFEYEVTVQG